MKVCVFGFKSAKSFLNPSFIFSFPRGHLSPIVAEAVINVVCAPGAAVCVRGRDKIKATTVQYGPTQQHCRLQPPYTESNQSLLLGL